MTDMSRGLFMGIIVGTFSTVPILLMSRGSSSWPWSSVSSRLSRSLSRTVCQNNLAHDSGLCGLLRVVQ